ncbi:inhibitor of KinA [Bacillus iocasae]|uniref:Inhibitor of KinA n=1 Tax=Priestia iocasae TaxID=2291674 RepID=A0ABS2QSL1_9BACI|nr:5-oxoprolinase subunit PxpB [Metabacillus iocasae]MBM7702446.1 inhibitor of KinA [Metabacillus iocasae]
MQRIDQSFQLSPLGDAAIVVAFGKQISEEIHKKVKTFVTKLDKHPFDGLIEYVPAFTTVTLYYNPWVLSKGGVKSAYEEVKTIVEELLKAVDTNKEVKARQIEIPVCYEAEFSPDLAFVAEHNGLSKDEVIQIHTAGEYLVYMIGFAPGFPYLGGMNDNIAAPRKTNPRSAIPKGSVGIAGSQTGVYPLETPGGWQIIGRTPVSLFNPYRESPSLLQAGDIVTFTSISKEEYQEREERERES